MTSPRERQRADLLLVDRGLAESRERAQAMILAGAVFSGEQRVEKAGEQLHLDAALRVAGNPLPYVGRGGLKMEGALDGFGIDPSAYTVLDVGSGPGSITMGLAEFAQPGRVWGTSVTPRLSSA